MLCKYNDVPVATNQNLIFELFLKTNTTTLLRAESNGRILYDVLDPSTAPLILPKLSERYRKQARLLDTDLRELSLQDRLFAFQLEVHTRTSL